MIDKLDLRIPAKAPFHPAFLADLREHGKGMRLDEGISNHAGQAMAFHSDFWRPSRYYEASADLREVGYPAILHFRCKATKKPNHKLELIETGSRTVAQLVTTGRSIFRDDAHDDWGIMRADLTADCEDVPVTWFKEHTYCSFKRTTREFGHIEAMPYQAIRSGSAETLYGGVAPNQFRIYNKTLEREYRRKKAERRLIFEARKQAAESNAPIVMPQVASFEELYGYPIDKIVTRVERQCVARDLQRLELNRVADLASAAELKPFTRIKFFAQPQVDLSLATWGFSDFHIGRDLQRMAQEFGINEVRRHILADQGRNGYRTFKKYQPWFSIEKKAGITHAELTEKYAASTRLQLVA